MGEAARQDEQTWLPRSEFERIYGPQQPLTPGEAAQLLADLDVPWWVAGGWAIEAFTGVARPHEDLDLSVFRRDLPAVRALLEPRFHLWAVGGEGLLHLDHDRAMPDSSGQVWVREHALAPWVCEFLLNPDVDGRWQSKRDPSFNAPLEAVTWQLDGVRYLNPELVLSHKVATGRPKDDDDLAAALPLLTPEQTAFLATFVRTHAPEHPWRTVLDRAT